MPGMTQTHDWPPERANALKARIRTWGNQLGFDEVGFAPVDLGTAADGLMAWLDAGFQGDMDYMAHHGALRARPAELLPGSLSVITVRLDYLPGAADALDNLSDPDRAYVSLYALGRDYHKVVRNKLRQLADRMAAEIGPFRHRACTDSAPVMEVELARLAGLGWRGKHTLLLNRAGSWFFLGELLTDLPLPPDGPEREHCGTCRACLDACPTGAIVEPYRLDARLCISYLTIEHSGSIPERLRPLMGNRIFGCDDCQLCCPWNRFASFTGESDFRPRHGLDTATLAELFAWSEREFLERTAGSAIRRIGHERWLRNIAVALGNAPPSEIAKQALEARRGHPSAIVREHVEWALSRQVVHVLPAS
jgi:epoxyqueuosine reductase